MSDQKYKPSDYQDNVTLQYILDVIQEGVWDWNATTGHVERSPAWYRMLGYDVDSLPNTVMAWEDAIHTDDYPAVMRHFEDYINGRVPFYEIEYRCKKSDGTYLWIRDQGKIVERNRDGSVARMIGAHLDIHDYKLATLALHRQNELLNEDKFTLEDLVTKRTQELEEVNNKLEENLEKINQLSNTDSLTSTYNRHKAETELGHEMARSNRYDTPLSVALFDIDNFKKINDTYGHQIGDQLLQNICKLIMINIRETDSLGRWGGDEFILILPGIAMEEAMASIEKIRLLIAGYSFLDSVQVTCSFGVTQYINGDTISSIYKRTDTALYSSKHAGRNAVHSY